MKLVNWAYRHGVSRLAIDELFQIMGVGNDITSSVATGGESQVQDKVRLEATQKGCRIWRNNVGACKDETGRVIRYGLCNDSVVLNKRIKSSDLIGIRPVVITQEMIGHTIGQFLAREVKKPGWVYKGTDREKAQLAFGEMIISLGGDFSFANDTGTI